MKRNLQLFVSFLMVVFVGCSGTSNEKAPPAAPPTPPSAKETLMPQPLKSLVVPVTPGLSLTAQQINSLPTAKISPPPPPPVYSYNPEGRKDPFKTFLQGGTPKISNPAFPLLNYPLSDLRLVAVMVVRKNHYLAMVQTPDGKGYTIRPGMEVGINRGKIIDMTSQSVSIEEEYTEISGEKKKRTVVLSLRPPEEGQI